MFCHNCGKELPDDSVYCDSCGIRLHREEQAEAPEAETVNAVPFGTQGTENTTGTAQASNRTQPKKKKFGRNTFIGMGIGAGAILLICGIVLGITAIVGHMNHPNRSSNNDRSSGYSDNYGNYGYNYGYPYGYGGSNGSSGSNGYGNYGDYGSGSSSSDSGNSSPSSTRWPSGDGTYDFYANSTIPKFESVTGKELKRTETQDGDTYYIYEMDMDAYNKYLEAIKSYGYSQSDFDVQGKDSYVVYNNDSAGQYLEIYLMNSENEIVVMA